MDAREKQKAIFRAKLNAQKREKQRIDSQLVSISQTSRDFFDDRESKRQKNGMHLLSNIVEDPVSAKNQLAEASVSRNGTDRSSSVASKEMGKPEFQASKDFSQVSKSTSGSEPKQAKGALPQGFFDDKDTELRARGITPVKPDPKGEYKEFEKLIKEDLQEIDNRLEEEEFDAAEMLEEEEMVEQRSYVERVDMLRRKKLELKASRSAAAAAKSMKVTHQDSSSEDSLSDDEDKENFKVDWRAKHL